MLAATARSQSALLLVVVAGADLAADESLEPPELELPDAGVDEELDDSVELLELSPLDAPLELLDLLDPPRLSVL